MTSAPLRYAIVLLLLTTPLLAATRTWTGASSGSWSDPANWSGTAPAPGDDLVFPAGAANLASTNDFPAGMPFRSITLTADGAILNGNAIALGAGGITSTAPSATLAIAFTLAASQTWSATGHLALPGDVGLNGFTLTFDAPSEISSTGIVSGTGALQKSGAGTLILGGDNTFAGPTTASAGYLQIDSPTALGIADNTDANGTTVSNATLIVNTTALGRERLYLSSAVVSGKENASFDGDITVDTAASFRNDQPAPIRLNGMITGSGMLIFSGLYALETTNTFAGQILIMASVLTLDVDNAFQSGAKVSLQGPWLHSVLDVNGHVAALQVSGEGSVQLGSGGSLTLTSGSQWRQAETSGDGTITVLKGSWLEVTRQFTHTGRIVNNGANVTLSNGPIVADYIQESGETHLSDRVQARDITIDGGLIAGELGRPGSYSCRNLKLGSGSLARFEVHSPRGRSDTISVSGEADLENPKLDIIWGSEPQAPYNPYACLIQSTNISRGNFVGYSDGTHTDMGCGYWGIQYSPFACYWAPNADGTWRSIMVWITDETVRPTLGISPPASMFGEMVTFTAHVGCYPVTCTGTITFKDGDTTLATAAVPATGDATFSTQNLFPGGHWITATYSGDSEHCGTTSYRAFFIVMAPAPTFSATALVLLAAALAMIAVVALRR